MKKRMLPLLLCVVLLFSVQAQAADYTVSGTDMTVTIDDSVWYVFTRDNLENNPKLDELGITADYLGGLMQENNMYMDACLFYEDGNYIELFVRLKESKDVNYMTAYTDSKVEDIADALAEKTGAEEHALYKTDYKYAKVAYTQEPFYLVEYYTIVNGYGYTFTFQSEQPYGEKQYEQMDQIMESVAFRVDPNKIVNGKAVVVKFDVLTMVLIGAVLGGVGGFLLSRRTKKRLPRQTPDQP